MIPRARSTVPGLLSHRGGLDLALTATVAVLTIGTLVMLVVPSLQGDMFAPAADLALDTVALVVTGSVAALAWIRFRESQQPIALYQAAAFLALAIANSAAVAVAVGTSASAGASLPATGSLAAVGQAQLLEWTLARMLAAVLLIVGGAASLRRDRPRYPTAILLSPAALVIAMVAIVAVSGDVLPSVVGTIVPGAVPSEPPDVAATPFGTAILILNAALFLGSAAVGRQLSRHGSRGDAFITLGLVIAAFAQLHVALFPGTHPLEVASGDLLMLGFDVVLLFAIEAEARSTLRALRTANQSLERLRDAELDRAALEERARLSRELHDGLAQDLWRAKLKAGRLAALPDLGSEATILCLELGDAIDSGLAEARQAVMALRLGGDGSAGSFSELLRHIVDDFSDRFGLRADLECEDDLPRLPSRVDAELLRITQEALSNVRRHADATLVSVKVYSLAGQLILTIRDNGRGFDTSAHKEGSFGLASMRERATLVGGHITIESLPADGTRITVVVPVSSEPRVTAVAP